MRVNQAYTRSNSFNPRAQRLQPSVDVLIPAIDLVDIGDLAGTAGRKRGNEEGDTGADIRRRHFDSAKLLLSVEPNNGRPVRVAENDLGAHVDEFIDKEQPAFKHFLVDKHCTSSLRGHHKHDADQVGGKAWPGGVRYR